MRLRSSLLLLLASSALVASPAAAQVCGSLTGGSITGVTRAGSAPAHPAGLPDAAVNRADCDADEELQLRVDLTPSPATRVEVWAGAGDCAPLAARTAADSTCHQVAVPLPTTSASMVIPLTARDLAKPVLQGESGSYVPAPAAICGAQLSSASSVVKLSVIQVDASENVCGLAATYDVPIDLRAADVTLVDVDPAESSFEISPHQNDPDVVGWQVQCAAVPAGAACDPVAGAASLAPCGSIPAGGGTIGGLTDGTTYLVAVSAEDAFGNLGGRSEVVCATAGKPNLPATPRTGGGSGSCAAGGGAPRGAAAWLAGAIGLALAARVRRRRGPLRGKA